MQVGRPQTPALFGGRMLVHRVAEPRSAFEWITFPVRVRYYEADGPRPLRTAPAGRERPRKAQKTARARAKL